MRETVLDRGESVGLMEPLLAGDTAKHVSGLSDLVVDLAAKAAGLRRSLPEGIAGSLANLVRAMNCYYSLHRSGRFHGASHSARAASRTYSGLV